MSSRNFKGTSTDGVAKSAETTPATGQNARLLAFAGGSVTAKGKLYDRGGSHALVIEQIAAAADKEIDSRLSGI